jgi:RimJ/RimL family protein N-acetyltransferase
MPNFFEGKHVRLRCYEPGDLELIYETIQRESDVGRLSYEIEWPLSKGQILRNIEEGSRSMPGTDNRPLAIETIDGKLIGGVAVFNTHRKNGTFEIGISIAVPANWGKGYAREAMAIMLRYMFHELRYQKCNISIKSFNDRAIRFHERLGFKREGVRRRDYFSEGQYHDMVLMGMTAEEYEKSEKSMVDH